MSLVSLIHTFDGVVVIVIIVTVTVVVIVIVRVSQLVFEYVCVYVCFENC